MTAATARLKKCASPNCPHGLLPRCAFYPDASRRDGLYPYCRQCKNQRTADYQRRRFQNGGERLPKPNAKSHRAAFERAMTQARRALVTLRESAGLSTAVAPHPKPLILACAATGAQTAKPQTQYTSPKAHKPRAASQIAVQSESRGKAGTCLTNSKGIFITGRRLPCPNSPEVEQYHRMDCVTDPDTGVVTEQCRYCPHHRVIRPQAIEGGLW